MDTRRHRDAGTGNAESARATGYLDIDLSGERIAAFIIRVKRRFKQAEQPIEKQETRNKTIFQ
ncbi:hypothetical protein [Paludibacterium yongneupense]|nr:hypothetical protein [Paludibacterium yongneupense]